MGSGTEMRVETSRCIIRKFAESDLAEMAIILSDDDVTALIEPSYTYEQSIAYILENGMGETPSIWAIEFKQIQKIIGYLVFRHFDDDVYEIGWILNKMYWEKGFGSEVTGGMVAYARSAPHINSIVLDCAMNNMGTKAIALKYNFDYIGTKNGIERFKIDFIHE